MPKQRFLKNTFTSGELSPDIEALENLDRYRDGAALIENWQPTKRGGLRTPAGLEFLGFVRRQRSTDFTVSGKAVTTPNGGTGANLVDGDDGTLVTTTTGISTSDNYVVAVVDMGAAVTVLAADVIDIKLSTGSLDGEFFVATGASASGPWSTFGAAVNVTDEERTHRAIGAARTARYWAIIRQGTTDLGSATVSVGGFDLFAEGASYGNARLAPFSFAADQTYALVLTDQNADVHADGARVASVRIPHTDAQIAEVTSWQSLDTLALFHKSVAPWRIFREGSDVQWDSRDLAFTNIPQWQYPTSTGGEDCVQEVQFVGTWIADQDYFTLSVEGEESDTILFHNVPATLIPRIEAALRALPVTSETGITVTHVTGAEYIVTFTGEDGKRPWAEMVAEANAASGDTIRVQRTTEGQYPEEDIWSEARGYPATARLHQGRLYLAGIPSLSDAIIASVAGEYFNLDDRTTRDDRGFVRSGDSGLVLEIRSLHSSQFLQAYADEAELFLPVETDIKPTNASYVQTTDNGIRKGTSALRLGGKDVYVDAGGTRLLATNYDLSTKTYNAEEISVLASHLLVSPVSLGKQPAEQQGDMETPFIVNDISADDLSQDHGSDYWMTMMSTLPAENILAFWRRTSAGGKFKDAARVKAEATYVLMERTLGGETHLTLERFVEGFYLDCATRVAISGETITATAGQTVFAYSFTSPATSDLVGVRKNGSRLEEGVDYTVDLAAQDVTLLVAAAAGDQVRLASGTKSVTGLERFEGDTICLYADGNSLGEAVVTSGAVSLGDLADTEVQAGLKFVQTVRSMPAAVQSPQGTLLDVRKRIPRVIIAGSDMTHLQVGANGKPAQKVVFRQFDSTQFDSSTLDNRFTGAKQVMGLEGWSALGQVELVKSEPGPCTIRGYAYDLVWGGV